MTDDEILAAFTAELAPLGVDVQQVDAPPQIRWMGRAVDGKRAWTLLVMPKHDMEFVRLQARNAATAFQRQLVPEAA